MWASAFVHTKWNFGVKQFEFLLLSLAGTFKVPVKGSRQLQSLVGQQLSTHIWHLLVASVKRREGSDNRAELLQSPSLRRLDATALDRRGRGVEKKDNKCCLRGSSPVSRMEGIRVWQWGGKKVTARKQHPGAAICRGCAVTQPSRWSLVRAGCLNASHVGVRTVRSYRVGATGTSRHGGVSLGNLTGCLGN